MALMDRLRKFWAGLCTSLIEDHPAGIPQFPVCAHFEETDCTLRGCYAVDHCRLHSDPTATMIALAKTIADRADRPDLAA